MFDRDDRVAAADHRAEVGQLLDILVRVEEETARQEEKGKRAVASSEDQDKYVEQGR
jgi:hypothetical protein